MAFSLYTITLIIAAVVTCSLSLYVYRYRSGKASRAFVLLLACMSWWSAMIACESIAPTLELKVLFSIASYPGSQFSPVLYFLFALRYTRRDAWLTRGRTAALFLLPSFSILMAATNHLHHLLWSEIYLVTSSFAGSYVFYAHGPWFWVEILYSYSLLFSGMIAFFLASFRYPPLNLLQCRLILGASIIPVLGNVAYALFLTNLEGIDPTPLIISLGDVLIALVIIRFSFLDLVPIAREQVIESMDEAMIILDAKSRIIDKNPSAMHMLGMTSCTGGDGITRFLPWWTGPQEVIAEKTGLFTLQHAEQEQWIAWSASEIREPDTGLVGVCLLLQDVTSRHMMEQALRAQSVRLEELAAALAAAHESLQLMTSITRHDILNMITVQRGYMEMALETGTPDDYQMAIKNSYPAALKIQELITFTRDFQDAGTLLPVWFSLARMIQRAATLFSTEPVSITVDIPPMIEISADPLIEKVLYVLMDNAIRHGESVTAIRFTVSTPGDLRIRCTDDGIGIAAREKESIFQRGVGKNTGLGLYLAKRILALNGFLIHEEGKEGEGACFVITVPAGRWRKEEPAGLSSPDQG